MVAKTLPLPNAREIFVPDPNYVIAEVDLAGADARVVAWEANDDELKRIFRAGHKIHVENARALWGRERTGPDGKREPLYTETKRAVHLTNYGGSAYAIQRANAWTLAQSQRFQELWFDLHPAIIDWHESVQRKLERDRSVENRFGFRRFYADRIESVLKEALAWVPQSTVAITVNKIWQNIDERLPWIDVLLQVHDSLVFQFPSYRLTLEDLTALRRATEITIPYPDPLVIPTELKISTISWGHCKEIPWTFSESYRSLKTRESDTAATPPPKLRFA